MTFGDSFGKPQRSIIEATLTSKGEADMQRKREIVLRCFLRQDGDRRRKQKWEY
jgi:hypothetical protein